MLTIDTWTNEDCTIGRLRYGDFKCLTLELPWRNNQTSVSCIPAGTYEAFKRSSPSNGNVVELKGVEGRSYIQIHSGNYTRQIRGCILVGDSIKYLDGDGIPDVTNSKNTLSKLLYALPNKFTVQITRI